jgi:hypothetical protein
MDMIFTDKTDWQLYFRLFLLNWCLDWSRWLFSWIWSLWKDGVKENRMNELGLLFWDFSDEQILKDMENVIRTIEFYIWEYENTPPPLKRELEV